jgi:uncharacterized protein (DUF3084 family)
MNSLLLAAMFVAYLFLATGLVLSWLFQRAESERQKTELGQIQEQWDTARKDRSFPRSDLKKWEQESDRVELCMCQEDLDRL